MIIINVNKLGACAVIKADRFMERAKKEAEVFTGREVKFVGRFQADHKIGTPGVSAHTFQPLGSHYLFQLQGRDSIVIHGEPDTAAY